MKIGLFLMGLKGLRVLQSIENVPKIRDMVAFVVSNDDKTVLNDYSEEILIVSEKFGIPFFWRKNFNNSIKADYYFAVSWKWLIKEEANRLIVFHDSLLPMYRGFNPLVTALIIGDNEIGVTAIKANAEFDKGNIVGQEKIKISYPIKIKDAIEGVSKLYEILFLKTVTKLLENELVEIVQNESKATYSLWRDEEDYNIQWDDTSENINRFVDSVGYPYNGAKTTYDGRIIRISDVKPLDDIIIANRTPGKIIYFIGNKPVVVCGKGLLLLEKSYEDNQKKEVVFNRLRIRLK